MSALVEVIAPRLPATLAADLRSARDYAIAEKSEATRRAYRSDFDGFRAYCDGRGVASLPATPETAAAYLAALADKGLRPSSIQRATAAIKYAHKMAGHVAPTDAEAVRAVMRGIRRTLGAAKVQKIAATADVMRDMLAACPDTLRGKRDRALLALGFAGAFRRSELVALRVEDLTEDADGYRVLIRKSKTDQAAEGQTIAILNGSRLKPVDAVKAWLEAAGITSGPIFRPINKAGRVAGQAMTPESAAAVVKQHAEAIGADPAKFGGHSLRAGYVTSAVMAGGNIAKVQEVSRHKSLDVLLQYVRSANLFDNHSGAAFL